MSCLWLLLGYNRKVVVARDYITCKTKNIYTLWLFKEKPAGSGTEVAADQWTNLGTTEKHRGVRNGVLRTKLMTQEGWSYTTLQISPPT